MAKQYGIVKIDTITYTTGAPGAEGDATIDVSGLGTLSNSGIVTTGTIEANSGIFHGGVVIDGTLDVSGIVVTGGDITASGATLLVKTLTTTDNAFIGSGGLTVTGDTTLKADVVITSGLDVGGAFAATGNISGNANGGVYGSGYWKVPQGPTTARPGEAGQPPVATGMMRFNTSVDQFEGYNGTEWGQLGGGATGSGGDTVFVLNEQVVTTTYTIPNNFNATSCGPITLNSGVVVNIGSGENWSIV